MLAPGQQVDRYEILAVLGGGGFGKVYKVRHTLLGSLHVLKVLNAELVPDPEFRGRFLAEGQIQARLRHPNIVAVTDILAAPGVAGLIVDLVEGPTLDEHIRTRSAPPTSEEVKEMFLPLLRGLGFAHAHGVVHRDIKPENIIVSRNPDGSPCPKILDFGIAKITNDTLGAGAPKGATRTGARMGTLHYMSPEQVQGARDVDVRTDIFSLAATLYEFVSGQVPFEADSDFHVMKRIVEGSPTPVRQLAPGLDPIVEACIIKGLARNREDRFESCERFAELLSQAGTARLPAIASAPRSTLPARFPPPASPLTMRAEALQSPPPLPSNPYAPPRAGPAPMRAEAIHIPPPIPLPSNPYAPPRARGAANRRPELAEGLVLAERGTRLRASLIDGAAVFGVALLSGISPDLGVTALLLLGILQAWLISARGQSLGKLALGIRIVNRLGLPPGFASGVLMRVVLTALLSAIPLIGPVFGVVNVLMIFGDQRLCLHDRLAGTRVVLGSPQP